MRNTWDSSKTEWTVSLRARADARSVPNGFSMITREFSARPVSPSIPTTDPNAPGGTARWKMRRGVPPISFSAACTAATSGAGSFGSAAPKCSVASKACHAAPVGFEEPNSRMASFACSRKPSSLSADCAGAEPMIWYFAGIRPALARWKRPGSNLRLARSPVAPNRTITWSSGTAMAIRWRLAAAGVFAAGLMGGPPRPRARASAPRLVQDWPERVAPVSWRLAHLLRVPAEFAAQRGQELVAELAKPAGLEPLNQRGGDDRCRHALVDRRDDRPAAFAGVGDVSREAGQLRRLGERVGGQVDQPRPDDRAAPPDLGDLGHVDVVLVVPGVAQGSGLRVGGLDARLADVGVLNDGQALGDRGHHPVLDAVVDHFHEVPGAIRPAVQIAIRSRPRGPGPAGGGLGTADTRSKGAEDGVQPLHRLVLAADHEAVAALEAVYPARGADVQVVDLLRLELLRAVDVVPVIGVAAVDHRVTGIEELRQLAKNRGGDRGGQHQPRRPGLLQLRDEVRHGRGAGRALILELLDVGRSVVVDHAAMAVPHQPADEVGPHPAQPDHAKLHRLVGCHVRSPRFRFLGPQRLALQAAVAPDERIGG